MGKLSSLPKSSKKYIKMSAITACNVTIVAKAQAKVSTSAPVAAVAPICKGLKAATLFNKAEQSALTVSNGFNTSAMMVWTPNDNKFFETFSFLPPLSDSDIAKQVEYLVRQGATPCLEFAEPNLAITDAAQGHTGLDSSAASGYYDNRYWTMWKLPMFGCTDPDQVLSEIQACTKAFPNIKQVQVISMLVHRPAGHKAIDTGARSV